MVRAICLLNSFLIIAIETASDTDNPLLSLTLKEESSKSNDENRPYLHILRRPVDHKSSLDDSMPIFGPSIGRNHCPEDSGPAPNSDDVPLLNQMLAAGDSADLEDEEEQRAQNEDRRILALLNITAGRYPAATWAIEAGTAGRSDDEKQDAELEQLALRLEYLAAARDARARQAGSGGPAGDGRVSAADALCRCLLSLLARRSS